MNDDMKRILEELEKDLLKEDMQQTQPLDEDLLEDMPWQLKTQKLELDIDAMLAKDTQQEKVDDSPAEEEDFEAILARILAESDDGMGDAPAFEDPDKPDIAEEPVAYCNYSNDYGNDTVQQEQPAPKEDKSEDKWLISLMSIASVLCLGIIGVLIYWMRLIP